jgi:pilus assembly protein CpaB
MGATRIAILATAAIAAIGIALIVRQMASHHGAPPPQAVAQVASPARPMTQVLVARRDLPVGTRLGSGDLVWQAWPADAVNPVYITDGQAPAATPADPADIAKAQAGRAAKAATAAVTGTVGPMEAIYGSIVKDPILASEPIAKAKLVRGGEGGYMAVVLRPGMRAVSVNVTVGSAAGGFILPGDRVDVMQGHAVDGGASGHSGFAAGTLLRNIRVLAIDQTSQPPKGSQSLLGAVATLEVPASDAEVLVRAKAQGEVVLALRSYSDAGGPSGRGGVSTQDTGSVRIIRNGQTSEVMVSP